MDRRTLIKMAAIGGAANVLSDVANAASDARAVTVRSAGTSGHSYSPALNRLVAYARQDLATAGMPGLTLCIVDAEGYAAVASDGWADVDRRIPVNPSHLFQIASISKSFAALCVYRLADEGKIDLDAPVSRYIPDAPLPPEPISVQQVLSHTAGLPRSSSVFPRVPEKRLWTGFAPGSKFSYSNTGYYLIGLLIERVTGKPYQAALRNLIVKPLGITGLREAIQASDRARYAVGYSPIDAGGPNMPHVPLGPTQWLDRDVASGCVGVTADAMIPYLQFLMYVGRGQGKPLFSDAMAKRFSRIVEPAAVAAFGKGAGYASGLEIIDFDGGKAFQHTGTTCGFTSSLTVDFASGVGCFVSVNAFNGGYRPDSITKYACRLLRQVREGRTISAPGAGISLEYVEHAEDFAGTYVGPNGDRFQLTARAGHLQITANGQNGRLQAVGRQTFLSDHPRFGSHFFEFERGGDDVLNVWFGGVLYGRGVALPQPPVPPELAALEGIYVSPDPLSGWRRAVIAEGNRLVIENLSIYRVKNTLVRQGNYWHPQAADNPCERIWFEDSIGGVPQRLNISGLDMWRFHEI